MFNVNNKGKFDILSDISQFSTTFHKFQASHLWHSGVSGQLGHYAQRPAEMRRGLGPVIVFTCAVLAVNRYTLGTVAALMKNARIATVLTVLVGHQIEIVMNK